MPDRKITTRFEIEGLDVYKANLKSMNSELSVHKSELNKVQAQYAGQQNTMEALTAKQKALADMHAVQTEKLSTLRAMTEAAQRAHEKYTTQIDEQKRKIADTQAALDKLKDSTSYSAEEEARLNAELEKQRETLGLLENSQGRAEKAVNNYTKQANNAEAELYKLDGTIAENERYLEEAAKSADGCATSIDGYGKTVKQAGEDAEKAGDESESFGERSVAAVDALAASLAAGVIQKGFQEIKQLLLDCIDASAEYETMVAKMQTLAGADMIGEMSAEVLRQSGELGIAASELADATYQAMSAGQDAGNAVAFAADAAKLAVGGFTDNATAVDVLTTALNAYHLEASESSRVADMLVTTQNLGKTTVDELAQSMGKVIPVAAAYDLELDNLSSSYALLTANGISTLNATTYLNAMLGELGDSASTVSAVLKDKTGKTFAELNQEGRSLGDIIGILGESVEGDSAAFNELWSSSQAGIGALSLLGSGTQRFNDVLDEMRGSTGAAEEAFRTMADTTEYSEQRLKVSVDNLKIAVGDQLTPILRGAAETGTDLVDWAADFVQEHPGVVKALTALTAALGVLTFGLVAAKTATMLLTLAMETNPFILAATAIAGVVAAIGVLASSANDGALRVKELTTAASDLQEAVADSGRSFGESQASVNATASAVGGMVDRMDELAASVGTSSEAQDEYRAIVAALNDMIPDLNLEIDEQTGLVKGGTDAIRANTEAWRENALQQAKTEALTGVYKKYADAQVELAVNEEKLREAEDSLTAARENQISMTARMDELWAEAKSQADAYAESTGALVDATDYLSQEYWDLENSLGSASDGIDAAQRDVDTLSEAIRIGEETLASCEGEITTYEQALQDAADAAERQTEAERAAAEAAAEAAAAADAEAWAAAREEAEAFAAAQWDVEQNARRAHEALGGMTEDLTSLMDEYTAAYTAAYNSIDGQIGLFDTMKVEVGTSVDDMIASLDSQISYMDTYAENLQKAAEMGVSDGLLAELSDGSTESAAYLQAIVDGGEEKVGELNEKFALVEEGKQDFADTVARMETDFDDRMREIVNDAAGAVDDLNLSSEARRSAAYTIEGYLNGLQDQIPGLYASMERMAAGAVQYWRRGLAEASPSRKMRESGRNTIAGYVLGLQDQENTLTDALDRAASLVKEAFPDRDDAYELARSFAEAYSDALREAEDAISDLRAAQEDALAGIDRSFADSVAGIDRQVDALREKLSGYGDLAVSGTINWSDGTRTDYYELADISAQTARIEQYGQMLDQLAARGINPSLMQEVLGMGVDEALQYGQLLLGLQDTDWAEYMAAYAQKMAVSSEIAEKYYAEERMAAQTQYEAQLLQANVYYDLQLQMAEEHMAALTDALYGDGENAGRETIDGMIAGLQARENDLYAKAKGIADTLAATINAALDIHSPSGVGEEIGVRFDQGIAAGLEKEAANLRATAAAAIPSSLTEPADTTAALMRQQTETLAGAFSTLSAGIADGGGDAVFVVKINGEDFARATLQDFRRVSAASPEIEVDAV